MSGLPRTGLFLNIFAPSVERAAQLMDYVVMKGN
jgi:hypothetical protein